jgi:hypothetical protein
VNNNVTKAPLVVAYGMGVDSTAMLIGLQQRGERPDLIMFADTGSEKPETYAYLDTINAWLDKVGFPRVTVVKNPRPKVHDKSLGESCERLGTLPALAYGRHQCSLVWKVDPQKGFVNGTQFFVVKIATMHMSRKPLKQLVEEGIFAASRSRSSWRPGRTSRPTSQVKTGKSLQELAVEIERQAKSKAEGDLRSRQRRTVLGIGAQGQISSPRHH